MTQKLTVVVAGPTAKQLELRHTRGKLVLRP